MTATPTTDALNTAHHVDPTRLLQSIASLAAYRQGATTPGATVMILSGGNVEPSALADILTG